MLDEPLMTEPEAARELRVSRITLQRLRLRGHVSYVRVGGQVRYTASHLKDYLKQQERQPRARKKAA
jgi:excisionase family DNA binding protein